MLAFVVAAVSLAASVPQVAHATTEECAVIVEIGRSRAAWGASGPNQAFVIDGPEQDGTSYREDCNWQAFGVGAPSQPQNADPRFAISRPRFGSDMKTATAELQFVAPRGPAVAPFVSIEMCELRKHEGHWKLVACAQGPIT
jgi:hypothetical protein